MFYSQFILAKKGPLGTIWIAAHLERKLRKNQVTETNISVSVDSILFPEVPIALRLSGHLLLGVVRIYSRKVNYLFHDCSEALVKIKQAFHAGAVDLPPEAATAPFHSITLPETFDLDEFEPLLDKELNSLHANGSVDHHITSREQITLQDPMEDSTYLGSSQFELDERFPDGDAPQLEIDFDEDLLDKRGGAGSQAASPLNEEDELPLEEDVIPPVRMDDELDYDQMDRMEEMDIDDHHEPGTPALGLDNMDLDYQREPDEQLDAGQDDLERLEPSFAMDHEDLGATDVGAERLAHEPATPGSPENEALDYKESGLDLDLEASVEHALEEDVEQRVEEHVAVHGEEETAVFDDREAAVHVVEEKVEQGEEEKEKVDEGVEREVEEQDETVKPSLETGVNISGEKMSDDDRGEMTLLEGDEAAEVQEAVIGDEQAADKELGEEGPADVPEYETVMSAPGITNQDPDVFDMDAGMGMEPASDFMPYEEGAREEQTAEEGPPIFEEEAHPGFQEEPQPGIAYPMSPMRSPPVPVISSEDLPGDDELLASLPGRRISALALVPTPVDNASAKPRRRQGQRKRKIVIDLGTILGADVMKQQLENTDDIRRVRRKAPCTRQELWSVQKDSLNQQLFCEHSVPGLCGELRVLFERVYVVGEANLPQADPVEPEMAPGEELPEVQQHSVVEDLNADMNVEVHPDDMKEIENEVAGSPVFDGVPDTAPVDHPQTEDTGAPSPLHIVERVSSPVEALEAKAEETQNLQIRTPVLEHGEQATLDSPKGELPNVLDTEVVNPVDLNSASLEMEEAMETLREEEAMEAMETMETDVQGTVDTSAREELELLGRLETPETAAVGEYHPMIDVNVTNTEVENEGLEGSLPEFGNAPGTEGIAGPDYGPATVSSDAEFASGTLPSSEAETEPYIQGKVEDTQRIDTQVGFGPGEFASDTLPMSEAETEPYIQGEVEDTQRIDTQVGFGPSDDVPGVGSVGFDTQILPTEEYSRQEEGAVYVPQEEGDFFSGSLPDDKTEADDIQPAVPFETAPVQEQPEENLEFLADARDTEFLGADDDDLVEEPEDFQELNEYARKEPVSHDNSGWSARTRAVGHFLRITLEDKDAYMQRRNEQGVAKLGLERMLVGKSRKEAARMFFETLVLKTKDYIHVEQDQAYGDIQISARPKLMKAKF